MTVATDHIVRSGFVPPGARAVQHALMWAAGFGGAIVFIEPSPYELVTVLSIVFFYATGLRMRPSFLPLLFLLVVLNIGYTICSIPFTGDGRIVNWVVTSWYMAITAMFFAIALSEDTEARLDFLRRGLIVGGVVAALAGIAGYFHLIPGATDLLTRYGRARGTFKDPNVLSAFLILPALFSLQGLMTAPFWKAVRSTAALGVIGLGLLLAFSRAAWGQLILTSAFMLILMYLTSPSRKQRRRIVVTTVAAVAIVAALLVVLLSFDSIDSLFKQRASFDQGYDEGRFGRFGRHILGFDMALDLPFGIGPLQFNKYFPEDTHNSFLNAFMSGGWISGVCFAALAFISVAVSFRPLLVKTEWRRPYLAILAAFVGTVGEAFIIDVDHWRHFWLMLGAVWGLASIAQMPARSTARRRKTLKESPHPGEDVRRRIDDDPLQNHPATQGGNA